MKINSISNQVSRTFESLPTPIKSQNNASLFQRRKLLKFKIHELLDLQSRLLANEVFPATRELNALLETPYREAEYVGEDEIIAALKRHTEEYLNTFDSQYQFKNIYKDFLELQNILNSQDVKDTDVRAKWKELIPEPSEHRLKGLAAQNSLQRVLMMREILKNSGHAGPHESFRYITGEQPDLTDENDIEQIRQIKVALQSNIESADSLLYIRPEFRTLSDGNIWFEPKLDQVGPFPLTMSALYDSLTQTDEFVRQLVDISVKVEKIIVGEKGATKLRFINLGAKPNTPVTDSDAALVNEIIHLMARAAAKKGMFVVNEFQPFVNKVNQNKALNALLEGEGLDLPSADSVGRSNAPTLTVSDVIRSYIKEINDTRKNFRDFTQTKEQNNRRIEKTLNALEILDIIAQFKEVVDKSPSTVHELKHAINCIRGLFRKLKLTHESPEKNDALSLFSKQYTDYLRLLSQLCEGVALDETIVFKKRKEAAELYLDFCQTGIDGFKLDGVELDDRIILLDAQFKGLKDANGNVVNDPLIRYIDPITQKGSERTRSMGLHAVENIFTAKDTSPTLKSLLITEGYYTEPATKAWWDLSEKLREKIENTLTVAQLRELITDINSKAALEVLGVIFPNSDYAQQVYFETRLSELESEIRGIESRKFPWFLRTLDERLKYNDIASTSYLTTVPKDLGIVGLRKRAQLMGVAAKDYVSRVSILHANVLRRVSIETNNLIRGFNPSIEQGMLSGTIAHKRDALNDLVKNYNALNTFAQNAYNHVVARDSFLKRLQLFFRPKTQESIIAALLESEDPLKQATGVLMIDKIALRQKITQGQAALESVQSSIKAGIAHLAQITGMNAAMPALNEWMNVKTHQEFQQLIEVVKGAYNSKTGLLDLAQLSKALWGSDNPKSDGILNAPQSTEVENLLRVLLMTGLRQRLSQQLDDYSSVTSTALNAVLMRMNLNALRDMTDYVTNAALSAIEPDVSAIIYLRAFDIDHQPFDEFAKINAQCLAKTQSIDFSQVKTKGGLVDALVTIPNLPIRPAALGQSVLVAEQAPRVTAEQLSNMLIKILGSTSKAGKATIRAHAQFLMKSSNSDDITLIAKIVSDAEKGNKGNPADYSLDTKKFKLDEELSNPSSELSQSITKCFEMLGTQNEDVKDAIITQHMNGNTALTQAINSAHNAYLKRDDYSRLAGRSVEHQRAKSLENYVKQLEALDRYLPGVFTSKINELKLQLVSQDDRNDLKVWFNSIVGANNEFGFVAINNKDEVRAAVSGTIDKLLEENARHPVFYQLAEIKTALDAFKKVYFRLEPDRDKAKDILFAVQLQLRDLQNALKSYPYLVTVIENLFNNNFLNPERFKVLRDETLVYDKLIAVLKPDSKDIWKIKNQLKIVLENNPADKESIIDTINGAYKVHNVRVGRWTFLERRVYQTKSATQSLLDNITALKKILLLKPLRSNTDIQGAAEKRINDLISRVKDKPLTYVAVNRVAEVLPHLTKFFFRKSKQTEGVDMLDTLNTDGLFRKTGSIDRLNQKLTLLRSQRPVTTAMLNAGLDKDIPVIANLMRDLFKDACAQILVGNNKVKLESFDTNLAKNILPSYEDVKSLFEQGNEQKIFTTYVDMLARVAIANAIAFKNDPNAGRSKMDTINLGQLFATHLFSVVPLDSDASIILSKENKRSQLGESIIEEAVRVILETEKATIGITSDEFKDNNFSTLEQKNKTKTSSVIDNSVPIHKPVVVAPPVIQRTPSQIDDDELTHGEFVNSVRGVIRIAAQSDSKLAGILTESKYIFQNEAAIAMVGSLSNDQLQMIINCADTKVENINSEMLVYALGSIDKKSTPLQTAVAKLVTEVSRALKNHILPSEPNSQKLVPLVHEFFTAIIQLEYKDKMEILKAMNSVRNLPTRSLNDSDDKLLLESLTKMNNFAIDKCMTDGTLRTLSTRVMELKNESKKRLFENKPQAPVSEYDPTAFVPVNNITVNSKPNVTNKKPGNNEPLIYVDFNTELNIKEDRTRIEKVKEFFSGVKNGLFQNTRNPAAMTNHQITKFSQNSSVETNDNSEKSPPSPIDSDQNSPKSDGSSSSPKSKPEKKY